MKKLSCVLVLVIVGFTVQAKADMVQLDQNLFAAGVLSEEFEFFAAPKDLGKQRQANWCWAASVQMVLNYHGLYITQEDIVERIFGSQIDKPGSADNILTALSGWAPDTRGRFSTIHAVPYVLSGSEIVQDLAYKWPLIVGLKGEPIGHAYVLTAVFYGVDWFNNPIFTKVVLRDPWPGSPSRVEMSWDDFQKQVMFVARVSVVRY